MFVICLVIGLFKYFSILFVFFGIKIGIFLLVCMKNIDKLENLWFICLLEII